MIFSPPAQWHFGVCVTERERRSQEHQTMLILNDVDISRRSN
jgi:hypothetical protein